MARSIFPPEGGTSEDWPPDYMQPRTVQAEYRVLVTGSREWDSPLEVYERLADVRAVAHESGLYDRFIVVHGACPKGADKHAARWCLFPDAFADMPVIGEAHPVNWEAECRKCNPRHRRTGRDGTTYCPLAGHNRNAEMVALGADLCLAFYKRGRWQQGDRPLREAG